MGGLTKGQWAEIAVWLTLAGIAFGFSFQFDGEVEGYRYGASGWPRVVIALIALGALGQLFQDLRKSKAGAFYDPGYFSKFSEHGAAFMVRMGLTLALPLVYAVLLQGMGYYFLTPFFLFGYLYLTGVRKPAALILVPLVIYAVITVIFTRVLFLQLPIGYWPGFYDFGNWMVIILRYGA